MTFLEILATKTEREFEACSPPIECRHLFDPERATSPTTVKDGAFWNLALG